MNQTRTEQPPAVVQPLRVLYLEDTPADVELCERALKKAGLEVCVDVVQSLEEFTRRLPAGLYDLVLSDYKLPVGTGLDALTTLKQQEKDIPFILVTGALGEETAVECIKQGAADYVLKDRLARLPIAVRRALEEQALREQRKLAVELKVQNEALARADHLKSEFLADMSHEFRTPLNSILGFSEMLLTRASPLSAEQREDLKIIHRKALHLLALVEDLLSIAQIESGMVLLDWGPLPARDLLVRVLDALSTRLQKKKLEQQVIVDPPDLLLYADERRLEEILTNLVANAVRHTNQGGITLRARLEGDHAVLSVEDTGEGIASEDQPHIFDKFYQARRVAEGESTGTGMGLAITRQLVELHSGKIWLESQLGQGARFFFTVPRAKPLPASGVD